MQYYRVEVNPKDGTKKNAWHDKIRGMLCRDIQVPEELQLPAFFTTCAESLEPVYAMRTSKVITHRETDDGTIQIETKNTYYTFNPCDPLLGDSIGKTINGVEAKI